jgi:hypothetical protein
LKNNYTYFSKIGPPTLTRGKKKKIKKRVLSSRKKELNRRLTDAKKDKSLKVINTEVVAVALIDYVGV